MKIVSVFRADSYSVPAVISVSLHLLLVIIITWGWEAKPHEPRVHTPRFVQATLVELTPKAAAPAAQPQQNVVDMRARQRELERQRQEAERRRQVEQQRQARERQAQQERERQAQQERERRAQAERERQAQVERDRQAQVQREREAQQRLDAALQREEEFFAAQQSQTLSQSYMDQIAARIEQNWSRPPSARLGMECVLLIQMVPTGRVVNVTVIKSSGNAAFDRSAEQAVKRVDQFTEVQNMPSDLFERNFRQLQLVFRPGDLRL
jgi:colicin import membrane protein